MALDHEKAQAIWDKLYGMNTSVTNRFNNYTPQFSYGNISGNLNDIFNTQEADVLRNTNQDIATQQQNAAESMASRGITGGSLLTDTQKGIASTINKNKINALAQLGIGKANATMNLKNLFNQDQMDITKNATNVDMQNITNNMQQTNALASFLNQREQLGIEQQNQPGVFDDIFSGLGILGQIGSIPLGGGSTLLGKLKLF